MSTRRVVDGASGERVTLREYAKRYGLSYMGVWQRMRKYGRPEGNVDELGRPVPRSKTAFVETGSMKVPLIDYAKALGVSIYSLQRHKRKYGTYTTYERYKHFRRPEPQAYGTMNGERVALRRWAEDNGESFSSVYHWAQRHGGDISNFHNRKKYKNRRIASPT